MAKYLYTITVNAVPEAGVTIDYKYRSVLCTLSCSPGTARLEYTMSTKKDISTPAFFEGDLVKDALRKMYLLHAMVCDSRLWIETITVTCGEESAVFDKASDGFPFLFSMLTARELALPESWQEKPFLEAVLTPTKSATDNDARFACLYSFLNGVGKSYEIDRFTCYWTAMNAHYNYIYHQDKHTQGGDADCMRHLLQKLDCGQAISSRADRNEHYKTNFGMLKSCLQGFSMEELEDIYQELYAMRLIRGAVPARERGHLYKHLHRCINAREYAERERRNSTAPINETRSQISAWGFLLLDYAYYMRCKYFHGNKTTVLFSAVNDREICALRCLNVFLGNYLREAIPAMFAQA